jgi:hypothetical protein
VSYAHGVFRSASATLLKEGSAFVHGTGLLLQLHGAPVQLRQVYFPYPCAENNFDIDIDASQS